MLTSILPPKGLCNRLSLGKDHGKFSLSLSSVSCRSCIKFQHLNLMLTFHCLALLLVPSDIDFLAWPTPSAIALRYSQSPEGGRCSCLSFFLSACLNLHSSFPTQIRLLCSCEDLHSHCLALSSSAVCLPAYSNTRAMEEGRGSWVHKRKF